MLRDLKLAARYVLSGDLASLYHGGLKRVAERVLDGVRIVSVFAPPSMVSNVDRIRLIRDPDDQSSFYPVVDERELTVASDDPLSSIELLVVFPELVEDVTVEVQYTTSSGETLERTRRIVPDEYFGAWTAVPVSRELDAETREATVRLQPNGVTDRGVKRDLCRRLPLGDDDSKTYYVPKRAQLGPPVIGRESPSVPVVLLSIDTLRHDRLEQLSPLLSELGDRAQIPAEPRTQGYWTAPSHASMFTGVHPGVHGYLGWDDGPNTPIHPELETAATLLAEHGYKCSGIVSHGRIRPQFGFGRGFHRFELDNMTDWVARENDARSTVDRLIEWIEADADKGQNLFYFAHLFDPHGPYIPPPTAVDGDLDLEAVRRFRERTVGPYADGEQLFNDEPDVSFDVSDVVWKYYRSSVRYTATQVARFVRTLKRYDLFEDALIIVTGDHGEEWGESGYFGHDSLYDANVRPFMAIKPPSSAPWAVPDAVDTIDFLPTISHAVGADIPDQCQGRRLQDADSEKDIRIIEGFGRNWYHVALERNGTKAITTFSGNYPDRPTDARVADGPKHVEYYRLDAVRDGDYSGTDPPPELKRQFEETIAEFVRRGAEVGPATSTGLVNATDQLPEEQLEYLGYK